MKIVITLGVGKQAWLNRFCFGTTSLHILHIVDTQRRQLNKKCYKKVSHKNCIDLKKIALKSFYWMICFLNALALNPGESLFKYL